MDGLLLNVSTRTGSNPTMGLVLPSTATDGLRPIGVRHVLLKRPVSIVFDSSTVMTPSLPTFCIASAINLWLTPGFGA